MKTGDAIGAQPCLGGASPEGRAEPASLMPDFEHPNEEGHRVWAVAIEQKVAELMGEGPTAEMPAKPGAKREAAPKH